MKTTIPPPLVFAGAGLVAFASVRFLPATAIQLPGQEWIAGGLILAGAVLSAAAVSNFMAKKTTVSPLRPDKATALVTGGLYRFTRNPMYLAMAMIILGIVVWLGAPLGLAGLGLAIWFINENQIKPEEAALKTIFGDAYLDYMVRVRRWI